VIVQKTLYDARQANGSTTKVGVTDINLSSSRSSASGRTTA
jgi:hypothetical protein